MASPDGIEERLLVRFGRPFAAGEVLFEAGDPAAEIFLLHRGRVELVTRMGAATRVIRALEPGDLFGEECVLPERTLRVTAVGRTDGVAIALPPAALDEALASSALAVRVVRQLARQLRQLQERFDDLLLHKARATVAGALGDLAREALGRRPMRGERVSLWLTPLDLAARVKLDVDTVRQSVQRLRAEGYVVASYDRVDIPDVEALSEIEGAR